MRGEKYIQRSIEPLLSEAIQYFSVLSLTGPRQSGKSTTIKHLFPNIKSYSLKDLNILSFAQNDPIAFLNQTSDPLFIDEVQQAPQLLSYIQGIADNHPERKFILSGSSNFEVLKAVPESLAGRAGIFELLPMSYSETKNICAPKEIEQMLFDGFYPAVCANKNVPKFFYPSYFKTYVEKDVRDLLKVKDMALFTKFMKLCAARIGSIFNASEMSNELGVDGKTITSWLSVLTASYIIYLLPPYYENISKRFIKSPKLYFCDTGLASYLLDIENSKQLERDKMKGFLFENFIIMEALKYRKNRGKSDGIFFYRDSNGNEVDLLLKEEGKINAYEIKSAQTYTTDFETTLKKLPEWIKTPVERRSIVYNGEFENIAGDIHIVNYKNLMF